MSIPLHALTLLHTQLFIANQWRESTDKSTFPVYNPTTEDIIAHVASATDGDVITAIEAAHDALPAWRNTTAKERSEILKKWCALILEHCNDLAMLMTTEQGKSLTEAEEEIRYAATFIEWFAEEAKRVYGDIIPAPRPHQHLLVQKEPIGVVAAITPWNFPAAMVTRKVAPALAAGCTVVLKPSEETPFTAFALASLAVEAGIPPGVFNIVTGAPKQIGAILTSHPLIKKISFTGSTRVGTLLAAQSAPTVKKLSLELGGNAPFIVFADADIDRAIQGLMHAKFRNNGQTCICANRVFVEDSVYEDFKAGVVKAVTALRVGNGLEENIQCGPLINHAAMEKVSVLLHDALQHGATLVTGAHTQHPSLPDTGFFFAPTIIENVTPAMRITQEEIFGPVIALQRFHEEKDVVTEANTTPYGLAAYVYTSDHARIWRLMSALEYGMIAINDTRLSNEVAPFGGIKQSGIGREGSYLGIEEYLQIKYICVSSV